MAKRHSGSSVDDTPAMRRLQEVARVLSANLKARPATLRLMRETIDRERDADSTPGELYASLEHVLDSLDRAIATPAKKRPQQVEFVLEQLQAIHRGEPLPLDAAAQANAGGDAPTVEEAEAESTAAQEQSRADAEPLPQTEVDSGEVTPTEVTTPPGAEEEDDSLRLIPLEYDAEMLPEFLTEAVELTQEAEQALLQLEATPDDSEAIGVVFRCFHTIKGGAAFLDLQLVGKFAHAAENILGKMRDGEISCTGPYADLSFRSLDTLSALLAQVSNFISGKDCDVPSTCLPLLAELNHAYEHGVDEGAAASRPQVGAPAPAPPKGGDTGASSGRAGDLRSSSSGSADGTLRVRTERLDRLVDMVGELVIANAMVVEDEAITSGAYTELRKKVSHLVKITRELHDLSMSMRMVPLRSTFRKMARVVRDVAQKRGRQARLETVGEETEIDRNMVDVISDPLIHMLRNAVDHGLESPEDREKVGKDPTGTVFLSAHHSSGNVVIELRDDGKGIDRSKIAQKAIDRGLIETDSGMSDAEVFAMIFEAGFSTAEKVTEVSGRGVGMDVVRRNIEALRGRIEINSTLGAGTRFTIRLPLTLAVSDGMLLRAGTERFIVPTHHVVESVRPHASMLHTFAERGEMVRVRDSLLPLIRIGDVFDLTTVQQPEEGLIVILRRSDGPFALLVDELLGQQQVVVKSLETALGKVPGVAGAAILGDGRVGLIIEPEEVATIARRREAMQAAGEIHSSEATQGGAEVVN